MVKYSSNVETSESRQRQLLVLSCTLHADVRGRVKGTNVPRNNTDTSSKEELKVAVPEAGAGSGHGNCEPGRRRRGL